VAVAQNYCSREGAEHRTVSSGGPAMLTHSVRQSWVIKGDETGESHPDPGLAAQLLLLLHSFHVRVVVALPRSGTTSAPSRPASVRASAAMLAPRCPKGLTPGHSGLIAVQGLSAHDGQWCHNGDEEKGEHQCRWITQQG
jgi:hypothetical protein